MSPETGIMQKSTIHQEAEHINATILKKQAEINYEVAAIKDQKYGSLRAELGYGPPDELDRSNLTDTRVRSVRNAVEVDALKRVVIPSARSAETIVQGRLDVENILTGEDDRLAVIVGPCSIHDPEQALDYASWVGKMRDHYADDLEIVMRTYLEKPRSAIGWKGLINDPNLDGTMDISRGLTIGRILLSQITDLGVPNALERVDSRTTQYFDDLSVYDSIGARDSETNRGRIYLSVTSAVSGLKNPTSGDLQVPVQGVITARGEHTYLGDGDYGTLAEIESNGNQTTHVILRGGAGGPNYQREHVEKLKRLLRENDLPEVVGIDASHGNCAVNGKKEAKNQYLVVLNVSEQVADGEESIKVVMIESNLLAGQQKLIYGRKPEFGISVTDECVGLDMTEGMLRVLSHAVRQRRQNKS